MASVCKNGGHWEVYMASNDQCEVTVQVHMSRAMAERIASQETQRLKALNPKRDDIPPESLGSAVLNVLGLYATTGRV